MLPSGVRGKDLTENIFLISFELKNLILTRSSWPPVQTLGQNASRMCTVGYVFNFNSVEYVFAKSYWQNWMTSDKVITKI